MSAKPTAQDRRPPSMPNRSDNGFKLALTLADDELAELEARAAENADHFEDGGGSNFEMDVLTTVQRVRATLAKALGGGM